MIEQLEIGSDQLPKEAMFYLARMVNLLHTRDYLEKYPLTYYSLDAEGLGFSTLELKKAVGLGIIGSLRILRAMGYSYEADIMLQHDRENH